MKRLLLLGLLITTGAAQAQTADAKALAKTNTAPHRNGSTTWCIPSWMPASIMPNPTCLGKAWLTLKPHFYPTDSVQLDAKGMDIKTVALVKGNRNKPLKYTYDGMFLNIRLDKTYKGGEPYTIYIDYVAKPDELKGKAAPPSPMQKACTLSTRGRRKEQAHANLDTGRNRSHIGMGAYHRQAGPENHPGNLPDRAGKICNAEQRQMVSAEK
jgi:hypothetical protein